MPVHLFKRFQPISHCQEFADFCQITNSANNIAIRTVFPILIFFAKAMVNGVPVSINNCIQKVVLSDIGSR